MILINITCTFDVRVTSLLEHNMAISVGAEIDMERTGGAMRVRCHVQETRGPFVVEIGQTP